MSRYLIIMTAAAIIALVVQSTAATAIAAALASSSPLPSPSASPGNNFAAWAQFCDDTDCQDNCGMWVDIANSGCLAQSGRNSLNVKSNGPTVIVGLVYSPADTCNCQTECQEISQMGCWALNSTLAPDTKSYRFINSGAWGECDGADNNCPP